MVKHIEHEVAYHYNSHPTEEDLVSESTLHKLLVDYLTLVLKWLVTNIHAERSSLSQAAPLCIQSFAGMLTPHLQPTFDQ